jgi:hypothetical protein
MHNVILNVKGIDHKNRNGLDNRRSNLRLATKGQNAANAPARGGSSRFKGVSWDATRRKWRVQIRVNGTTRTLGRFLKERDAAEAYREAALEAWGEFACTDSAAKLATITPTP